MDSFIEELGKGIFRGLGYFLSEIFFRTVCYWLGWPICKLFTLGKYPDSKQVVYFEGHSRRGYWCSTLGFIALMIGMVITLALNT